MHCPLPAMLRQACAGGSRAQPAMRAGWRTTLAERWDGLAIGLKIAMVGKYTGLSDAYLSVLKALQHACLAINRKLEVQWIEASDLEDPGKARSLLLPRRVQPGMPPGMQVTGARRATSGPSSGRARSPRRMRRHGHG